MRPVEWIEENKEKKIRVVLRTGKVYSGILVDYYVNGTILLDSLYCYSSDSNMRAALLNGATIAYIESIPL